MRLISTRSVVNCAPISPTPQTFPQLLMEREHAQRAQRLLQSGGSLALTATIETDGDYAWESANVIGEIRGTERPEEVVLFGAHLDSHDLGTGVNVTIGLPFVRTSPDHGTAFDIAGTGAADSSSMVEAIRLATTLAKRRFDTSSAHV